MGLDPATKWLMGMMLGSQGLGAALAPEGTEMQSFADQPGLHPRDVMNEFRSLWGDQFNRVMHDAYVDPYKVQTTVNPLPSFVGGGLPMAIGVPGQDPERLKKRAPGAAAATASARDTREVPTIGPRVNDIGPPGSQDPELAQVFEAFKLLGAGG